MVYYRSRQCNENERQERKSICHKSVLYQGPFSVLCTQRVIVSSKIWGTQFHVLQQQQQTAAAAKGDVAWSALFSHPFPNGERGVDLCQRQREGNFALLRHVTWPFDKKLFFRLCAGVSTIKGLKLDEIWKGSKIRVPLQSFFKPFFSSELDFDQIPCCSLS